MIYMVGPGTASAVVQRAGTYSRRHFTAKVVPQMGRQDEAGLKRPFTQFSVSQGLAFPSHG